ncbi:IS1-like element transposase, partial [Klebsiella pneumoniae]|nr:hypothetical protein [Klebsiella pneumoniae]MBM0690347.1 hypothetical protein [Klebsiella pneumoniae]MCH3896679.1 hypothetical protein [Klebsiella pneumoniae]
MSGDSGGYIIMGVGLNTVLRHLKNSGR